jgi:hypothetical protein
MIGLGVEVIVLTSNAIFLGIVQKLQRSFVLTPLCMLHALWSIAGLHPPKMGTF